MGSGEVYASVSPGPNIEADQWSRQHLTAITGPNWILRQQFSTLKLGARLYHGNMLSHTY